MAANGRGAMRTQGRTPPFLVIGLLVALLILGFNYWRVSSRNGVLNNEAEIAFERSVDLQEQARMLSTKNLIADKKSETVLQRVRDLEGLLNNKNEELTRKDVELSNINKQLSENVVVYQNAATDLGNCNSDLKICNQRKLEIDLQIRSLEEENIELKSQQAVLSSKVEQSTGCPTSCYEAAKRDVLLIIDGTLGINAIHTLFKAGLDVGDLKNKYGLSLNYMQPQAPVANVQAAQQQIPYQQGQVPYQQGQVQDQQGQVQDQQGLTQDQQGQAQGQQGQAQDQQGRAQDQQGPAQNQQGPAQDQQGQAQDWQGRPQDQQGRPQDQQVQAQDQQVQAQDQQVQAQDQQGQAQDQQVQAQDQQVQAHDQQGQAQDQQVQAQYQQNQAQVVNQQAQFPNQPLDTQALLHQQADQQAQAQQEAVYRNNQQAAVGNVQFVPAVDQHTDTDQHTGVEQDTDQQAPAKDENGEYDDDEKVKSVNAVPKTPHVKMANGSNVEHLSAGFGKNKHFDNDTTNTTVSGKRSEGVVSTITPGNRKNIEVNSISNFINQPQQKQLLINKSEDQEYEEEEDTNLRFNPQMINKPVEVQPPDSIDKMQENMMNQDQIPGLPLPRQ